jgi:hypothetical protein
MIIGLLGEAGSGKDTVANYLISKHGYSQDSFAASLKDAVSAVFGWDREALEGKTSESREWRETVDSWWSERLNIPDLTPRLMLQQWGTDVCRNHFHNDIWIASLERRLSTNSNTVISDCRFPNEIDIIKKMNGITIRIYRGASISNNHISEYAWKSIEPDYKIYNNESLEELYSKLDIIMYKLRSPLSGSEMHFC